MKNIFLLLILLPLFSCVRAEKEGMTQVTLTIPEHFGRQIATRELNPNGTINPSGLSDLNCYAVLISGPEEGLRQNTCQYKTTSGPFQVGYYEGGFFSSGAATTLNLIIPSGKDRAIRLIGFQVVANPAGPNSPAEICKNFKSNAALQSFVSDPYILNESTGLDMPAGGEKTIDMKATFAVSNQVGDCKGPGFENFDDPKAGVPTKFAVIPQDGIGAANATIHPNSCVGFKIQLQDAAGNRANTSSNAVINAKLKTVIGGAQVGYFYRPGAAKNCDATELMNPTSADVSLSFNQTAGGALFNDIVFFFTPRVPWSGAMNDIQVSSDMGSSLAIAPGTFTFVYNPAIDTPVSYGVYDLFNNKSTVSATTQAMKNVVRAGECRVGALQILGSERVPQILNSSTGPYQQIKLSSTPDGTMQFFLNSSDCTTGANAVSDYYASVANYTAYGSLNFYYKVIASTVNFSVSATNLVGTGTPFVISGDLSPALNFWGTSN